MICPRQSELPQIVRTAQFGAAHLIRGVFLISKFYRDLSHFAIKEPVNCNIRKEQGIGCKMDTNKNLFDVHEDCVEIISVLFSYRVLYVTV